VRAKYYRKGPNQESIFTAPRKNPDGSWSHLDLYRTSSMPIRRHAKVQAEATAYDPAYDDYFRQRREKQRRTRAKVFAPARTTP
jgi:RNA-directed DNA polymerase